VSAPREGNSLCSVAKLLIREKETLCEIMPELRVHRMSSYKSTRIRAPVAEMGTTLRQVLRNIPVQVAPQVRHTVCVCASVRETMTIKPGHANKLASSAVILPISLRMNRLKPIRLTARSSLAGTLGS
jgi:hypothetical protein